MAADQALAGGALTTPPAARLTLASPLFLPLPPSSSLVSPPHQNAADPRYRRLPYSTNRKLRSVLDKSTEGQAFLMALGYRLDRTGDLTLDLRGRSVDGVRPLYSSALSTLSRALQQLTSSPAPREVQLDQSLPPQPAEGSAGVTSVTVKFVKGGPDLHGAVVSRRFDAGDTLRDVKRFVEGSIEIKLARPRDEEAAFSSSSSSSAAVPAQDAAAAADYQLVDRAQQNRAFADDDADTTLQALGLWPSANLTAVVRDASEHDPSALAHSHSGAAAEDTHAQQQSGKGHGQGQRQRQSQRPLPSQLLNAHKSRHEAYSSKRAMGTTHSAKRAQAAAAAERRAAQDRVMAVLKQEAKAQDATKASQAQAQAQAQAQVHVQAEAEAQAQAQMELDEAMALQLAREFENEAARTQSAQA